MRGDKRGISDVITTVLMILLVIAAIAVLWVVIGNFLSSGTDSVSTTTDCMQTELNVRGFDFNNNTNDQKLNVTVERISGNGPMSGFNVIIAGKVYYQANPLIIGEFVKVEIDAKEGQIFNQGDPIEVSAVFNNKPCPIQEDTGGTLVNTV